jgi:hypothetical protein
MGLYAQSGLVVWLIASTARLSNLVASQVTKLWKKMAQQMSKVEALSKTFANFAATFFFQGALFLLASLLFTQRRRGKTLRQPSI